ncbi:DivIVA domain-containing protein [Micromonospora sp. NPDC094482]|uniref:DivIVA domain-containing protein n=1 Tax=unclassified Micromonospora TaxID=2617518 RepID=UPI0033289262
MGQLLLMVVVALTVAAVVFGVTVLVTGRDPGLMPAEPDGRAVPLPGNRPLRESDVGEARFDTALRGYRMIQVDQAMRRAAYDIGYKSELIGVLEAEVAALREGRTADADALRRAREQAAGVGAANGVVSVPGATPAPAADGPAVGPVTVTAAEHDPNAQANDTEAKRGAGRPGPAVPSESA